MTPPRSTADAAAPLHERLEALLVRDSTGREITPVFVPAAALREAAAALRPPEGEVGLLCGRLEADAWIEEDEKGEVSFARRIRAALAHLRRLAAAEAERDRLSLCLIEACHLGGLDPADYFAPAPAAEGEVKCEGCGTSYAHGMPGSRVTEDDCDLCPTCANTGGTDDQ